MNEHLKIAFEIEKARSPSRQARKDHYRKERTSPTGNRPERYRRTREGVDSYLLANGKIVAQTIHYTTEDRRS